MLILELVELLLDGNVKDVKEVLREVLTAIYVETMIMVEENFVLNAQEKIVIIVQFVKII